MESEREDEIRKKSMKEEKNEWKDVSIFKLTDQEVCDLRHMR